MKISVIIPTYNRERTIKRCISSITSQTTPPYEIIIVDDGSTDKTISIVNEFKANIKIIKQNHRGAQAARNLGILNAQGDYIAFLDSDDEWLPYMLEMCEQYMKGNEESVLYSDGIIAYKKRKMDLKLPGKSGDLYSFLLQHPGPMFQSMIVKKSKLLQIGLLDEKVSAYQEWDTAIRLAKICPFVHIYKPLFIYHIHEGETISKDWRKGIRGYHYIVQKNRKEIEKRAGTFALLKHYKVLGGVF